MRPSSKISAPRLAVWPLTLALGVMACGDSATPQGSADASPTGHDQPDGGGAVDLGSPAPDALPSADAVGPPADVAVPAGDAHGSPSDAAAPPLDRGPSPTDGSPPPPVAGRALVPPPDGALVPPPDGARPPGDTGTSTPDALQPPVSDASPGPADGLVPPVDAVPIDASPDAHPPVDATVAGDGPPPPPEDARTDFADGPALVDADCRGGASCDASPAPPDAVAPPLCPENEQNACGTCGPLPEEICNGLDDDCDGETDEGDADADGLSDCGERRSGLDPATPDDPADDPDHDEISNAEEVAAGSYAAPVLRLVYAATEDPAVFEVRVMMAPATPELRPILVEIFLRFTGRAVPEDCEIGEAAALADKDLFWHPFGDDQVRFTLLAANLQRIGAGELARVRFRRTGAGGLRFTFIPHAEQLAPIETQDAATYGIGDPDEPLVVAGVPLLVNEVDYDQVSTDTAEFVELVNPNGFEVGLDGLALEVRNGLTGALISSSVLADAGPALPAGGRLVYGMPRVLATLPPGVLRLAQGPNLPNAAGSVRVVDTRMAAPPEVLDGLGWEGARADLSEGRPAAQEDPNDRPALGLSRCPDSLDGDDNAQDFTLTAPTPGGSNACP
ncbi:hypothetical protein L6V77_29790 [Myxococcota bacterium]|nr:hypothetical protein [Myxococcota bacterium]